MRASIATSSSPSAGRRACRRRPRERAFSDRDVEAARRLGIASSSAFRRTGCSKALACSAARPPRRQPRQACSPAEAFVRPGDTERDVASAHRGCGADAPSRRSSSCSNAFTTCTCASSFVTTWSPTRNSPPAGSRARGRSRSASRTWSISPSLGEEIASRGPRGDRRQLQHARHGGRGAACDAGQDDRRRGDARLAGARVRCSTRR